MSYKFNSQFQLGETIAPVDPTVLVKNIPMLFSANLNFAYTNGGLYTQYQEGWDAFFKLFDKDENPYNTSDEVSAFDWEKGWMDAANSSDKWDYKF